MLLWHTLHTPRAVWAVDVPHSVLAEEDPRVAISVVLESALSVKSLNLLTLVSGGGSGFGLGRCVSGSPGADLVKEEAVSEV